MTRHLHLVALVPFAATFCGLAFGAGSVMAAEVKLLASVAKLEASVETPSLR